jgi:tetratricopeptide (TPR) repeat protein
MTYHARIAFLFGVLGCLAKPVGGQTAQDCEALYERVAVEARSATAAERARRLERDGNSCMGTGMFDVKVAFEYMRAGENGKAVQIANSALAKKTQAAKPNLMQVLAQADINNGDFASAERRAREIEREFPKSSASHAILGTVAAKRQDWNALLKHSRAAYEIEPNATSMLGMAGALHQLNRHEETVELVYRALKAEPERVGRTYGLLEAIYSLAILNRRPEAAELARRHIGANPNWRNNWAFAQAAFELGVAKERE